MFTIWSIFNNPSWITFSPFSHCQEMIFFSTHTLPFLSFSFIVEYWSCREPIRRVNSICLQRKDETSALTQRQSSFVRIEFQSTFENVIISSYLLRIERFSSILLLLHIFLSFFLCCLFESNFMLIF